MTTVIRRPWRAHAATFDGATYNVRYMLPGRLATRRQDQAFRTVEEDQ